MRIWMKTISIGAIRSRVEPRSILLTLGFTALTIAAAKVRVYLGFTPVPVTLQTMVAILAGMILGRKLGVVAMAQYLLLGLAGAPVFSAAQVGHAALRSATFGYIPGLLLAAYVSGLVWEKLGRRGVRAAMISGILGAAAVYVIGVPWFACWQTIVTGQSAVVCSTRAWLLGMMPFIGADMLKAVIAAGIVGGSTKRF
jgi:biotin transport system substrate-specific component